MNLYKGQFMKTSEIFNNGYVINSNYSESKTISLTSRNRVKFRCENEHEYEMTVGHKITINTKVYRSGYTK